MRIRSRMDTSGCDRPRVVTSLGLRPRPQPGQAGTEVISEAWSGWVGPATGRRPAEQPDRDQDRAGDAGDQHGDYQDDAQPWWQQGAAGALGDGDVAGAGGWPAERRGLRRACCRAYGSDRGCAQDGEHEQRREQAARPDQRAEQLVARPPVVRHPQQHYADEPADDGDDQPADEQQHDRDDFERAGAAGGTADGRGRGGRAGGQDDVLWRAKLIEHGTHAARLSWIGGPRLGDVRGDLVDQLAPPVGWQAAGRGLEPSQVLADKFVVAVGHCVRSLGGRANHRARPCSGRNPGEPCLAGRGRCR